MEPACGVYLEGDAPGFRGGGGGGSCCLAGALTFLPSSTKARSSSSAIGPEEEEEEFECNGGIDELDGDIEPLCRPG